MKTGYFSPEDEEQLAEIGGLDPHDIGEIEVLEAGEGVGPLGPYFQQIEHAAHECFHVAQQARRRGFDPEPEPEIPFAEDLASRVEALVGPEGVADRIRELSEELGREELALTISKEVAAESFCEYEGPEEALDGAIRTGLAILTEGILVAPLEGVAHVKVRPNDAGEDYADVYFAGPIRAAGGTGQALSVLIADVVRRELGLGQWNASAAEVERFKEEIPAYKKAANLQYTPGPDEVELIVRNLPVGVNGEGTEQEEVSGYRDMARVETNQLRGGACLVLAEGLTLKAPKILKHVEKLGLEGWEFLESYIKHTKGDEEDGASGGKTNGPKIQPVDKFIKELTAGRPVLSHPMAKGGFRLRYGRARTAGLASTAVHPALTVLTDDFLAVGTQLKVERPGKGTVVTPCDTIEPPIVRLKTGDVVEVASVAEAEQIRGQVEQILDLGEMLVPFGEFLENNKTLPASAWCPEWWRLLVEDSGQRAPGVSEDEPAGAFAFAKRTDTPLHPRFTLFWHDLELQDFDLLARVIEDAVWRGGRLELAPDDDAKELLETLGATHAIEGTEDGERIRVSARCSLPVVRGAGFEPKGGSLERVRERPPDLEDPLAIAEHLSGVALRAKAPCRIGARMGRPEKAALREMSPPVHTLFPLGGAGGLQRLIKQAAAQGEIGVDPSEGRSFDAIDVGTRACPSCEQETLHLDCPACGERTEPSQGRPRSRQIPLRELVEAALDRLSEGKMDPNTKGVQGLISETKLPEPIEKGILRAKHGISVFKDGTCRFDMTDLSLTQFRPREIGTSVEELRSMGYLVDVEGEELSRDDQLLELKPQDIVINEKALEYMAQVAEFVDDLLMRLYGIEPFYQLADPRDLIGHLAVGLAPHTSGGVLCRIIGTTRAQGHWGHPFFHAAKRRNCLAGETEVVLLGPSGPRRTTLEDLHEGIAGAERKVDDVGTMAKTPTGGEILAVDPATGRVRPRRITKVYRSPAPDHLLQITTQSGRTVTCTPAHRLYTLEGEALEKQEARAVEEGTQLVFAGQVPAWKGSEEAIDLVRELLEAPIDGVMIRGLGSTLDDLIEELGGLKAAASSAGLGMKPLDNYRRRGSIPLEAVDRMLRETCLDATHLPHDVRVAMARDTVEIPRTIPFSPASARLIGYYLAEGHARAEEGSYYQVQIAATEEPMVEDIQACVRTALDLDANHDDRGIVLSGRLIHHLFTGILGLGSNAHNKRIPARIAGLPMPLTSELLAAYFAGDGSVERGRAHVACHSANRQLLRDVGYQLATRGIAYRIREETRRAQGAAGAFYEAKGEEPPEFTNYRLSIRSDHAVSFLDQIGIALRRKEQDLQAVRDQVRSNRFPAGPGDLIADPIRSIEIVPSEDRWVYDLEVEGDHNYLVDDNILVSNCDGDEDCIMLLLDGLLNFSRTYLPDRRGGQMDAPLTLSIRIDPGEIDKEAHNIECVREYPLAFYEATTSNPGPKEVEDLVEVVSDRLGSEDQYTHIRFTHDTTQIDEGPLMSAYKTIDTMLEKMEGQLELATRIRAVDEGDVASRVICDHFLPDIIGNLKAFSRQVVRCAKCNAKYRRVPLTGRCRKCKNTLTMTVHEASVKKYIEVSKQVSQRYPVDAYTHQRLRLAEEAIDSLFQNDKVKKAKLTDFM